MERSNPCSVEYEKIRDLTSLKAVEKSVEIVDNYL